MGHTRLVAKRGHYLPLFFTHSFRIRTTSVLRPLYHCLSFNPHLVNFKRTRTRIMIFDMFVRRSTMVTVEDLEVEDTRPSDWWHADKVQLIIPQSIYPIRASNLADSIAFQPSTGALAGVAFSELLGYGRGLKDPKKPMMVDTSDRPYMQLYIHVSSCGIFLGLYPVLTPFVLQVARRVPGVDSQYLNLRRGKWPSSLR
jgi:hypothetical protein